MDVSSILINTKNPNAVVKQVRTFLDSPGVEDIINKKSYSEIETKIRQLPLGWQAIGLLWAILRDTFGESEILEDLEHIPDGFYAYNNINGGGADFSYYNIKYIGNNAFYKSNLDNVEIPKSCTEIKDRAFCDLECSELVLKYNGTKKEWRSVKKAATIFNDNYSVRYNVTIVCSDEMWTRY